MKLIPLTMLASMLAGVISSGQHWWGDEVALVLMGFIYGVIVGFCTWIFMTCLSFLLCLPFPHQKKGERPGIWQRIPNHITGFFLIAAPILAWFVAGVSAERML